MKPRTFRILDRVLGTVKYVLAFFMMFAGISTALLPPEPAGGDLGVLFSHRITIIGIGAVFFCAGLLLLLGKLMKNKKWVGWGLMASYLSFLFGAVINGAQYDWRLDTWTGNLIASFCVGGLWIWWRFKTKYINVHDFRKQALELDKYKHLDDI